MVISKYYERYHQDIIDLVKSFHNEAIAEYGLSLDFDVLSKTINDVKRGAYLLIANNKCEGVLAGREVKMPTGPDRVWHEVIWYVNKNYRKYGVYLLKHARRELKEEGFSAMVMICMETEKKSKLFNLYNRLGFRPMEHHFIGRL